MVFSSQLTTQTATTTLRADFGVAKNLPGPLSRTEVVIGADFDNAIRAPAPHKLPFLCQQLLASHRLMCLDYQKH